MSESNEDLQINLAKRQLNAKEETLKEIQKQDKMISVGRSIVNICVIAAASVLFNFFPERVGMIKSATDPSSFTPLLAAEFQSYLSWPNLWWGLAFSLHLVHLILRRWTVVTQWVDLALRVFGAFLLGWMVLGAPFIVVPWGSVTVKFILAVVCVLTLIGAGKHFNRLLRESELSSR